MKAPQRPKAPTGENVLTLADYRTAPDTTSETAPNPYAKRIDLVKHHVLRRLQSRDSPAVAVAAAFVDSDGNVGICAAGIEPEMAASISHELRSLATRLETHAANSHRKQTGHGRRQRGGVSLLILSSLAFIAATYINEIAWLDAALSLAAQLTAAYLSHRSQH